jgi:hypothetical protein
MTERKSRSPREILSRFDDAVRRKRGEGQSSADDMSIFDVVPTEEKNDAQSQAAAAAMEPPGHAEPQRPGVSPQPPQAPRPGPRSWELAEAARAKQLKSDTTTEASAGQVLPEQMGKETRNSLFRARINVTTIRQKAIMMLVPVLFVILVFLVIRGFVAPWIARGGNLRVKGILYDQDNASAIVNGQILHEGEQISGAKIIRINKDSVEFEVMERWPRKGHRRHITKKVNH